VIVPNARVPEFLIKPFTQLDLSGYSMALDSVQSDFAVEDLLSYLRTQLRTDGSNKHTVQHLNKVCQIVLGKQTKYTFKKPFSQKAIDQVVEASADMLDLGLLENVSTQVKGPLPVYVYLKIGAILRTESFEKFQAVYVLVPFFETYFIDPPQAECDTLSCECHSRALLRCSRSRNHT
jgi:hypothetical protein